MAHGRRFYTKSAQKTIVSKNETMVFSEGIIEEGVMRSEAIAASLS